MGISVRQVNPKKPEIYQMLCKLHKASFPPHEERCDYREGFWWIASDTLSGAPEGSEESRPVAFGGLQLFNSDSSGFLASSGVIPEYRGLGIQRKLIRARVRKAQRLNLHRVMSYTSNYKLYSANNLIREGFTLYEPDYSEELGGRSWLFFEKAL